MVIPQVGQVYVANLTLGRGAEAAVRPARDGSTPACGSNGAGTTRFQLSLAKLRNIQVYVAGDVVRPGAYQISSAGTVLTALYAAGGPTANGTFRRVMIRRGTALVDSLDLYDYLTSGKQPDEHPAADR